MENTSSGIVVMDGILPDPQDYRARALALTFGDYNAGHGVVFKGIAHPAEFAMSLPGWIYEQFPGTSTVMTFFRKSPLGQEEPNYIHSDNGMGNCDWTGILYLNENPPQQDGTMFWRHVPTGKIAGSPGSDRSAEWAHESKWESWRHVHAAFNRLLLFPAGYFHSRAIRSNYGVNGDARLIQVVFGKGDLCRLA